MKTIEVVAAILRKGERVFATQRGYGDWKDLWEFSPILITAVILRAFSVRFITLKPLDFPGIFHGNP